PMGNRLGGFEAIGVANHFVYGAEAEFSHDFAQLLRDKSHEIHYVLRGSSEVLAQTRVLCSDADRTGIQVADPHHDATHSHERRRGKAKFVSTEERRHGDVPASLKLAIGFDVYAATQVVEHQRLVRFG